MTLCISWNSFCVRISKSGAAPSAMRWRWRRMASICRTARSVVSALVAEIMRTPAKPGGVFRMRARKLVDRHHDDVVLVAAERRLPLRLEHAEHAVRVAPDADRPPDRVLRAEELLRDRRAEDADLRLERLVVLGPHLATRRASSCGSSKYGEARPVRRSVGPVLVSVDDLRARAERRRRPPRRSSASRAMARRPRSVRRLPAPVRPLRARDRGALREHDDEVRPDRLDLPADRVARAGAERGDRRRPTRRR